MYQMSSVKSQTKLNSQALEDTIIRLATAALTNKPKKIKPNAPLLSDQIGFDSFSLMEFVFRLEEAFEIQVPDQDLDPDIFYSIETVVAYIQSRLRQKA